MPFLITEYSESTKTELSYIIHNNRSSKWNQAKPLLHFKAEIHHIGNLFFSRFLNNFLTLVLVVTINEVHYKTRLSQALRG